MKIYTKRGDRGETVLADGTRVSKSDVRIDAYGTLDELNTHIGVLAGQMPQSLREDKEYLGKLQNMLFSLGAYLACCKDSERYVPTDEDLLDLEACIDGMLCLLPSLREFILPSGTSVALQAHVCRTVCRRFERRLVDLSSVGRLYANAIRFANRLSDYLFVLARKLNFIEGVDEKKWQKPCK